MYNREWERGKHAGVGVAEIGKSRAKAECGQGENACCEHQSASSALFSEREEPICSVM
jgi:hypothetical protein